MLAFSWLIYLNCMMMHGFTNFKFTLLCLLGPVDRGKMSRNVGNNLPADAAVQNIKI